MKESLQLIEAGEGDYEFAREVHHSSYREMVTRQYGEWIESDQDDFFSAAWKRHRHCLIMLDGIPVGYCAIERFPGEIRLQEIAILPEFQRQGIGSRILKQLVEEGRAGSVPVKLNVMKTNTRAKSLYERSGFRRFDETETHCLMIRE